MFKGLKNKLKDWIKKTEEETEEIKPEKKKKETGKKAPKKSKKRQSKAKKEIVKEKPVEEVKKKSFFKKTLSEEKFGELFDDLEMILLQNNVAYEAVESMRNSLKKRLVGEKANIDIAETLRESIENLLQDPPNLIEKIKEKKDSPYVILFTGINGSGKTTTIAKITKFLIKNKLTVCLASADTFRAAAIEQLQIHADKLKVPLIKKDYGADPAAVGFDAIKYAKKNNIQVVLIDTAGRMNNRDSLMKEIEKISRVNSPDLKIFLGESITGNDATTQAKDFNDAIGIDGIVLSKADIDERGGTAISVSHVTNKPIYFLGTGQRYEDLEIFNKEKLLKKIFD
jgi:fused signal recognition particle receptor